MGTELTDTSEWARAYIAAQSGPGVADTSDTHWWAVERFFPGNSNPEEAWKTILQVLKLTSDERALGMLAAGPLEDLIHYSGDAFIDRIEHESRTNPTFLKIVGLVWESGTQDIWRRVQLIVARSG